MLVVLGLLGMLSLLGLIYFSFANQEQQNATYFAETAKGVYQEDDIERIFNSAMKQIMLGAEDTQKNSVMWGRRHSMLFNLIGVDAHPHSGSGVNLIRLGSGELVVDQDRDGAQDSAAQGYDLRDVNDSPAAQYLFERNILGMPAPDVDYTYPDHNNMFLGYKGYTWDYRLNPPAARLVIKPSFHRPELFRDSSGTPLLNWAIAKGAVGRSFRAHPYHAYVWRRDTSGTPQRRFIIDGSSNPALDPELATFVTADAAYIGPSATSQVRAGFPFLVNLNDPATGLPDATISEQGIFSAVAGPMGEIVHAGMPSVTQWDQYEFDVDNDGDGVMDGIWMDFDMPILVRPSDNRPYTPLISAAIYDLDSLLNANAVGNTFGETHTNNTTNFGDGGMISVSSQGLSSPSEINPLYALDTVFAEASAEAQTDLTTYFGHVPANLVVMANMEYWLSLKGHVRYTTPNQIYAGRFGEANRMWNVLQRANTLSTPPIGVHAATSPTDSNLFPFPGQYDIDDNRDANEGHRNWMGGSAVGQIQAFRHPLALGGRGRFWAGPKQLAVHTDPAAMNPNPVSFMAYNNIFSGFDALNSTSALTGTPQWYALDPFATGGTPLMNNTLLGANFGLPFTGAPFPASPTTNDYFLVDDSNEVILDPKSLQRPYDEPFEAIDTLFLQMSSTDRNATGITSRLADTMPGNLAIPTGASSANQVQVGQRFTTLSWDMKQFGLPRVSGPGVDGAAGVASYDDNGNGLTDEPAELGFPGSDDDRAWEFNVDSDGDNLPEFPPQFNPVLPDDPSGATPYVPAIDPNGMPYRPENAFGARDPFRPQLRRLLGVELGATSNTNGPQRLSINEFLDVERRPGTTPSPYTSPVQYRQLTPHSTDTTVANLPTPTPVTLSAPYEEPYTLPAYPPAATGSFSAEEVKEFWARRDRQQMARDIYVLLYTFCGGNDSAATGDVTTIPGFTPGPAAGPYVHPASVRQRMAQFAVNMVDSLDTDNVVTAFEFDNDLSNGWGLDDDPATNTEGLSAMEREVVYGVETPQLTMSEVAWYRQTQQTADNTQTPFNDTTGEFNFVQIELRSIFPENVQLALTASSSATTGIWRILRDDNNNGIYDAPTGGPGTGENAVIFSNGAGSIAPGALYTIASSDADSLGGGGNQASALYIDHTGGMTDFELVLPNKAAAAFDTATGNPAPVVNLDLVHMTHTSFFTLANGTVGEFLGRANSPTTNTNVIPNAANLGADRTVFRLQRRLHPQLVNLSLAANPFVTVDSFDRSAVGAAPGFVRSELDFNGTITNQAQAAARLAAIDQSSERAQPLNGAQVAVSTGATPSPLRTTLTATNSNNPAQFAQRNLSLPHFDRDFASVAELFHIPLFGPARAPRDIPFMWLPSELAPATAGANLGQLGLPNGPVSFGAAVMMESEDSDGDGSLEASEDLNGNGVLDPSEDSNGNGRLNFGEDVNYNGALDSHPYHFHRLLAFVEVPSRMHRHLDPLLQNRTPGKLSLNGIRDPRVLASLTDDLQVHSIPERDIGGPNLGYTEDKNLNGVLDPGEDTFMANGMIDVIPPDPNEDLNGNGQWDLGLTDVTGDDPDRDWWGNFLFSREGIDPTSLMPLPLSGTSRPFRDLGLTTTTGSNTNQSLHDSVLRPLPDDLALFPYGTATKSTGDGRRLFELDNADEFRFPTSGATPVAPLMQHRLLSKMIGNTTTRSNCFVVFVTVGMFECVQYTPPGSSEAVTRIGAPLLNGTTPVTYRKAFIVDRSAALEAYDKATGSFDWKKLVMAQQRIN